MASFFNLTLDTLAPAGLSLILNDGAQYATSATVTAKISVTDAEMCIRDSITAIQCNADGQARTVKRIVPADLDNAITHISSLLTWKITQLMTKINRKGGENMADGKIVIAVDADAKKAQKELDRCV